MSYTTDRYNLEDAKPANITLTQCGVTENRPLHASGMRIYHEYSMHFILEGRGVLHCDGKAFPLGKGEGFLILPGVPNEYIGDEKEPWKYIYISFTGPGAGELIADAGLGRSSYTFAWPQDADTIRDIYAMHAAGKIRAARGYGALGYMLAVMSRLVAQENAGAASPWSPRLYVEKAKRFIADNYAYDVTVENVAAWVGIDRTYLYRLFLKHENCSPSRYIWNMRLSMAVQKLAESAVTISEAALSSGYGDVSHFYKAFEAHYGCSPRQYREHGKRMEK